MHPQGSRNHTGIVHVYQPSNRNGVPYWSYVPRESEEAGACGSCGSDYLRDPRSGAVDGKPTLTDAEAIEIVRREFPKAVRVIVLAPYSASTGYRNPVVLIDALVAS